MNPEESNMPTPTSVPQADGGDRPTTKCDVHPDQDATVFISARRFGAYRCNLSGCADAEIDRLQGDRSLAYVRMSRQVAA